MACLLSSGVAGLRIDNVDVHVAQELLAKGHRYLDVRTEEEFKKGHVENALNIPYMIINKSLGREKNPKFMNQVLSAIGKEEKLVVGCKSGVRSMYAIEDLLSELSMQKFKHVCNMEGGFDAWVKKGLPVHYPNKTEL
ncbi:PREDICTED: thiosulfate sulfurtransferase 16, chloroplastic-like isoform X2 [Ipomoea nil]|uniref:thiosulfate sulfurtransferase 16, chloroplastic-like isoform X2 n=1 Tax=Ipomoea nil TaxID=35883 RepID=UPI000900A33C|nr:PREDICTED: thiosulfate sulfurtransferase 16, chloroplastic-like isoform X2 [Ipomoea nil]